LDEPAASQSRPFFSAPGRELGFGIADPGSWIRDPVRPSDPIYHTPHSSRQSTKENPWRISGILLRSMQFGIKYGF